MTLAALPAHVGRGHFRSHACKHLNDGLWSHAKDGLWYFGETTSHVGLAQIYRLLFVEQWL
jgi:hypothetical protein